jgi:hypothetical protein
LTIRWNQRFHSEVFRHKCLGGAILARHAQGRPSTHDPGMACKVQTSLVLDNFTSAVLIGSPAVLKVKPRRLPGIINALEYANSSVQRCPAPATRLRRWRHNWFMLAARCDLLPAGRDTTRAMQGRKYVDSLVRPSSSDALPPCGRVPTIRRLVLSTCEDLDISARPMFVFTLRG